LGLHPVRSQADLVISLRHKNFLRCRTWRIKREVSGALMQDLS
jgi:hypothetical protein